MSNTFFVVPVEDHNRIVAAIFAQRGFSRDECQLAAHYASMASWHGNRTHNAIKALHLDDLFGSRVGGCKPQATIDRLQTRFPASQVWNANRKLGQPTADAAITEAIRLADQYGIGQVSVDFAFHYLWGGGYVMQAAKKGYIAYTHCTASLAEVVPFNGKRPTLGTNPHSWGFPTTDVIGFPIVIDWATSVIAMGRVQQLEREGALLPAGAAVDAEGRFTTNPKEVHALTTFGGHKGYGLSLINELVAAYIGGSLPTIRSRWGQTTVDKQTPSFYFQVIHPEALSGQAFAYAKSQNDNVRRVLDDILGPGNENALLPGQPEHEAAERSQEYGGLLFSKAEVDAINEYSQGVSTELLVLENLRSVEL